MKCQLVSGFCGPGGRKGHVQGHAAPRTAAFLRLLCVPACKCIWMFPIARWVAICFEPLLAIHAASVSPGESKLRVPETVAAYSVNVKPRHTYLTRVPHVVLRPEPDCEPAC